jgi:glycosyltransferase involved in cell wall biosynthesis
LKILQINAINGIRSTGRLCTEIADYLNSHGDEGYIAYPAGPSYEKGYKISGPIDMKFHALFSRVFGLQAYFSKFKTNKLLKYISELKPDVVHLHILHGNFINLKMLLTYLAQNDIPTVITLHDCWFFTGKCCHYTTQYCYKWQSECKDCPRIHNDNPSWFFDRTNKMYHDKKRLFSNIPRLAVVGVSDWLTNEARKSFLKKAKILQRIHNWIDLEQFKPCDSGALRSKFGFKNKFIILGVATWWTNAKGLDKFICLARHIPDYMVIVLVGNLDSNIDLPLNIIHIEETQSVEELARYYSMADAFVTMSMEESFGKVSAEALACGTPVIAFDSTANPELVGDGCGYVVSNSDLSGVYNAIKAICSNGKLAYTDNCVTYAKKMFAKEDRILDYIKLYKDIAE